MSRILTLAACLAFLAGCSEDVTISGSGDLDPYLPGATPDEVVENVVLAWELMDIDGYAALLFEGEGEIAPYKFHFISARMDASCWDCEEERTHTAALFSGDPGPGEVPGVESVALSLAPLSAWISYEGEMVGGDPAPDGCRGRTYTTIMRFQLEGVMPGGGDIDALQVNDRIRFFTIPLDGSGATEYRLWKWMDLSTNSVTESFSLGEVKALYAGGEAP